MNINETNTKTPVVIKEVIIVEGKSDERAVKAACAADTIATSGFGINAAIMSLIEKAASDRGILILTDPDYAGEKIRERLRRRFPDAKHAWIPRAAARKDDNIGVENAKPADIVAALQHARPMLTEISQEFTQADIISNGLTGGADAVSRRGSLGRLLGIGYGNSKTFLRRLNMFGVTRAEFEQALKRTPHPQPEFK
ncbi:MAG: ribonuclease M5 [Clostridiales Family XIII bacterium]|jgi:ribonuclease M5|nr:ribonuclease M5 [Clostridiales Family XIII bacterium]